MHEEYLLPFLDIAFRQRPYKSPLLGLRPSLTELPADAAAAAEWPEWVKSFSDILARRVPTLIWPVLISLENIVASFGTNAYRCVRRPVGSHASSGHAQLPIAVHDNGMDRALATSCSGMEERLRQMGVNSGAHHVHPSSCHH